MAESDAVMDSAASQGSLTHAFPNHSGHMLEQLNLQRHHGAFTDIIVRVGDEETGSTDFRLHRCVLCASSSKLQLLVFSTMTNTSNVLTLTEVSLTGFTCIVDCIYTGVLRLDLSNVQEVLATAHYLELQEVERVVVEYMKKDYQSMPPTEAALSLMRMSQGIGLGAQGGKDLVLPPGEGEAPSSVKLPPITWVSQTQTQGSSLYSSMPLDTASLEDYLKAVDASGMPPAGEEANVSTGNVLVLPANPSTSFAVSSPLGIQIPAQDSTLENSSTLRVAASTTPLPLAILSPDGQTTIQILSNPGDTTNVTSGGDLEEEAASQREEDTHVETAMETEDICPKSEDVTTDHIIPVKCEKANHSDEEAVASTSQAPDSASREIAIQTSIASYTVRMKRQRKLITTIKRKRGRPRKGKLREDQSSLPEAGALEIVTEPAEEIKKRPLKKRLKEEMIVKLRVKPRAAKKESKTKTEKPAEKKKAGRVRSAGSSTGTSGGKKVHECPKCGRPFGKRGAALRHLELHEKGTMYCCHICGHGYPRPSELTQHLRKHASNKWHCSECTTDFEDPRVFKKHMTSVHRDTRPFKCQFEDCSFRSSRPSNVDKHGVIHSGVKSYTCPQCSKCFAQPNGLQSHLKSCYQKRNYVCDLCGQRFNYLQSMKSHRMLHTGEKPYQCADCGARFADHRNYKRHKRVHEHGGNPTRPGGRKPGDTAIATATPSSKPADIAAVTTITPLQVMEQQPQQLPAPPPPQQQQNNVIIQTNSGFQTHQILTTPMQPMQPVLHFRINDQVNVPVVASSVGNVQLAQHTRYLDALNTNVVSQVTLPPATVAHTELVQQLGGQTITTWGHVPFARPFENL